MRKYAIVAILATSLAACQAPDNRTAGEIEGQQQERLSKQAVQTVGLPAIVNFQEKRILKDIIELRDSPNLVTYTYIPDFGGHLHKVCNSVGYGIPYATQYTNPQQAFGNGQGGLPQADPNGLYSPASADGTWVLCKVPGKDDVKPVYIEPRIITSPFPLS